VTYKRLFTRSLAAAPERLHFAAHSHHLWPDASYEGQLAAWDDAARLADHKWDRVMGKVWPEAQANIAAELKLPSPDSIVFAPNTHELIAAGMVRKVICSAARGHDKSALSAFEVLYKEGKIELEVLPQGTFVESIRAAGAGIPAYYTPTAFGTDLAVGKEVRNFDGRDYVLEKSIPGDAALIRADVADRWGNLTFRHAQMNFGPAMATASKLVVAEVRAFSDTPIPPEQVMLSGVFVDRILVVGA